jgi:hypothetical protein
MKEWPENWEKLFDVNAKMFSVSIEVQTAAIVIAKDSIDAVMEAKCEIENIMDDAHVEFDAIEINEMRDIPYYCFDDVPYGSIDGLTCGDLCAMKKELQNRREAWEKMDKNQVKFSFYDEI